MADADGKKLAWAVSQEEYLGTITQWEKGKRSRRNSNSWNFLHLLITLLGKGEKNLGWMWACHVAQMPLTSTLGPARERHQQTTSSSDTLTEMLQSFFSPGRLGRIPRRKYTHQDGSPCQLINHTGSRWRLDQPLNLLMIASQTSVAGAAQE